MLSKCLLTAAEEWSPYFQACTMALFASNKQIRTCTGQRVWCLLCLLYCRQSNATPPEACCSHYSCYTSVTNVPLSLWHTQDPFSILYMLNDRHSFECFVPRRSLCLRFLASRFQYLETVKLRYFFCDTALCHWALVVPRFESVWQSHFKVSWFSAEFYSGYSTVGGEFTTPYRKVCKQTFSHGAYLSLLQRRW